MAGEARLVEEKSRASEMTAKANYQVDAARSQFTAQAFSGGLLSAFGHSPVLAIRNFSCAVDFDSEAVEHSRLRMVIDAASLAVKNDVSDKDRAEIERTMREEILETAAYPEIVYECSNVAAVKAGDGQYSVTLNGDLIMHGVSRSKTVAAQVALTGDSLRAFGTFSLLQSDYDLKLASVAGGALKVKDELKFSFNIFARKKE
jgi:polyisoprenoid-binding protein YceI